MGKKERRFLMKVADGFWLSKKGYNVLQKTSLKFILTITEEVLTIVLVMSSMRIQVILL